MFQIMYLSYLLSERKHWGKDFFYSWAKWLVNVQILLFSMSSANLQQLAYFTNISLVAGANFSPCQLIEPSY